MRQWHRCLCDMKAPFPPGSLRHNAIHSSDRRGEGHTRHAKHLLGALGRWHRCGPDLSRVRAAKSSSTGEQKDEDSRAVGFSWHMQMCCCAWSDPFGSVVAVVLVLWIHWYGQNDPGVSSCRNDFRGCLMFRSFQNTLSPFRLLYPPDDFSRQ